MSLYVNGRKVAPVLSVGNGAPIEIDDELSLESENPVQNKVITARINELEQSVVDRFEAMGSELDEEFADIDARFEELGSEFDGKVEDLYNYTDAKFEELEESVDSRFEDVNQEIENLDDKKVNKVDFLTTLDVNELWYGVNSSESSEEEPEDDLEVVIVPETLIGVEDYVVEGHKLTLLTDKVCKVGYEDVDGYVMIEVVENADGSHSFVAPEFVNRVFVVLKGDANLNGEVTMEDADLMFAHIHNDEEAVIEPLGVFAANINNRDGIIDSDAVVVSFSVLNKTPLEW